MSTVNKQTFCYDIETLKTYFSAAFINIDTNERYFFEVYEILNCNVRTKSEITCTATDKKVFDKNHRVNNVEELLEFLKDCKGLIGYNNLVFDYPIIYMLQQNRDFVLRMSIPELNEYIYAKAQSLIGKNSKFGVKVQDSHDTIPQLDLLEMNYFNSKNRYVSLKQLEFVMRYPNVQDMPYNHGLKIKYKKQAKEIKDYNFNDVDATLKFYNTCKSAIQLRKDLSKKYKKNLINFPETGLAKEAFGYALCKEMNISREALNKMKSPRKVIDVKNDVLLPMLEFKTEGFKALLKFYENQHITLLKGFFKDIKKDRPGYDFVKKYSPKGNINNNGTMEALAIEFKGHTYTYGSGGIHSKFKGKVVKACDKYCLWDVDVTSYYPSLSIVYGFKPEHLGDVFMKIYKETFDMRVTFPKGTVENAIAKLMLNSLYGLTNNEYSFVYDPRMTAQICINGQLLLTMLIEQLILETDAECIMANTDGATFKVLRTDMEKAKLILEEFSKKTKLNFETVMYSTQYYRDVNSYIWIPEDTTKPAKLKGCFDPKPEFYKDHSMLIVQKSLKEYFLNNVPVEETITNSKNIYDFCKMVKVSKGCKYVAEHYDKALTKFDVKQGKVVRYYVTKSKGHYGNVRLMKYLPALKEKKTYTEKYNETSPDQTCIFDIPNFIDCKVVLDRISHVEANNPVEIFNEFVDKPFDDYNVDLQYYINECNKVIKAVGN